MIFTVIWAFDNTPNRINNKPSKRNVNISRERILNEDRKYRLNSYDDEIKFKNYIRINNENLEACEVAKIIKEKFDL